jgi:hypothetical protein
MIGFTILMGLMVFVLWKDITRLLGWWDCDWKNDY